MNRRQFIQGVGVTIICYGSSGFSDLGAIPLPIDLAVNGVLGLASDTFDASDTDKWHKIRALNLAVNSELIGGGHKNVACYAYQMTVSGRLSLPGNALYLFARNLVLDGDVVIDLSGSDGVAPRQTAANGNQPGQDGADGVLVSSQHGKAGGTLLIFAETVTGKFTYLANGGHGALGQTGGKGQKGATPAPAPANQNGAGGLQGGRAGAGGDGGNGGDAGSAYLCSLGTNADSPLTWLNTAQSSSKPGSPGDRGKDGYPGPGGDGGPGGPNIITYRVPAID